jgi:hypothetical protein
LEPFNKWSEAMRFFRAHESTKNGLHEFTFPIFFNFLSRMSGATKSSDTIIDAQLSAQIKKNRLILQAIIDVVIHCARINSSFRGHRDDSKYLPVPGEYSSGRIGCFNETVNFAIRNGNSVLENHLAHCSKYATYISKTSQNNLIKCCGEEVSDVI